MEEAVELKTGGDPRAVRRSDEERGEIMPSPAPGWLGAAREQTWAEVRRLGPRCILGAWVLNRGVGGGRGSSVMLRKNLAWVGVVSPPSF